MSKKLKEPDWINQNYKNKMRNIQTRECLKMLISKRRLVHAISYEVILLVIIAIALSFIFSMPLEVTGILGTIMAVISVIWNMIFNHYFEKIEHKYQWQRTIRIRILHAIGFEGGLMLATIPIIAYMMNMSFIEALILDFGLTMCILVYTFIFQWCYDIVEGRFFPNAKFAS
ncbi:MAG: hypothetical protein CL492_15370 [Acinetobacter sp.]|nr:hypothetical protein [Acinetobacter sp.]MBT48914.1 hypothetical protein [Acinetobacter sp.]